MIIDKEIAVATGEFKEGVKIIQTTLQAKDKSRKVFIDNSIEKELTNDEILVILNSKEVDYPVNNGFLFTVKLMKILILRMK